MITTYVIGVTGGIGSGKTTVCDLFAERHGVPVIDADQVARDVVEPGQPAFAELVAIHGDGILTGDGQLDRRRLRDIVFNDPGKRAQLEAIVHPRIRARMRDALERIAAPYCLLGIPLLAEGGDNPLVRRVLVVDCDEATQIARVRTRDDLTEAQVIAIMRSQATRAERLRIADDIILNDGDRDALIARVDALHQDYLELARKTPPTTDPP
ncbi:MAG: dephospho-CoA kinase [Gammaproteobacteria bacterium]